MKIEFSDSDLQSLVDLIIEAVETRLGSPSDGKMLWSEQEAANDLGVSQYFLKEARQQGHIRSHSTKRPILYTRDQIEAAKDWIGNRS